MCCPSWRKFVAVAQHRKTLKKKDRIRLSLDLLPEAKDHLDVVQRKSQAATFVEVFRKALALYELVLDHQASKGKVVLENADGSREVLRVL